MDIVETGITATIPELTFPYPLPQPETALIDIVPGVKWLRMPLPYALDHVNIYLVQVDSGWVIVDTGLDSPRSRAIWAELFSGPLQGETVVGIFCTHFHVDHVGLAGHLAEELRVPLFMTYEEYFSLRGWPALTELPWQYREFFLQAGFPEERLSEALIMFDFSDEIAPLPPSFIRMQEGGALPASGGAWQIMIGSGHSPEHAMLYSAEKGILISGDQLLPRISSNVSISVVNPQDEPLSCWLASLDRLGGLPEDTLVLPGHGLPFRGAGKRVEALRSHHDRRLRNLLEICAAQQPSAFEIVQERYPAPLPVFDLQLALGECLAHLRYLLVNGRLAAAPDDRGVDRYRTIAFAAEGLPEPGKSS